MQTNAARRYPPKRTHEGAPAVQTSLENQLRRSVMSCMLWEDTFYEDGVAISDRIKTLADKLPVETVAAIALDARSNGNLRHAPLFLLSSLAGRTTDNPSVIGKAVAETIQRPDELTEFLSIYWKDGRKKLPAQFKKGLREAFTKFSAYSLAKYNRQKAVKLRDVLRLVHPTPKNGAQSETFKKILDGTLESPDTWEVALSGGADKKETFERLLREGNLGYFALLRNLRNMEQSGVDRKLVNDALIARKNGAERILPFRFIAAGKYAPSFIPALDKALLASISEAPVLPGTTAVLVDVSGSMHWGNVSAKSELTRMDAAAALASIINAEDLHVFAFSDDAVRVNAHRGMAGIEAIMKAPGGGTRLGKSINTVNGKVKYDRIIVVTDEQSADIVGPPLPGAKGYMINVATYEQSIGYGDWTRINGFSESVIRYIYEIER